MKRIIEIQIAKQPNGFVDAVSVQNIAEDNVNPIMDEMSEV
jgi:hypothetical protein